MVRNKRGSSSKRGGRGGGRGRGQGLGRSPDASHSLLPERYALGSHMDVTEFTLTDEARQTSLDDRTLWGQDTKLRRKPVTFISTGASNPLKQADERPAENVSTPAPEQRQTASLRRETDEDPIHLNSSISSHPVAIDIDGLEQAARSEPFTEERIFLDVQRQHIASPRMTQANRKTPERQSSPDSSSSDEVILFKGRNPAKRKTSCVGITLATIHTEIRAVEKQLPVATRHDQDSTRSPHNQRIARTRPHLRGKRQGPGIDREEEAILADYIANMRENGEMGKLPHTKACNQHDLGGSERDIDDTPSSEAERLGNGYVSSESTVPSDDDTPERDHRPDGLEMEDDRDATHERLTSQRELGDDIVGMPRSNRGMLIDCTGDTGIQPLNEMDLSGTEDEDAADTEQNGGFDELDFMDWERPSLHRKKGKGAKAQLRIKDCDPELEQKLQAAWKNDRLKKSQRKKQREELRALGMLGTKARPEDLRIKYPTGMSMKQVAEELKDFLLGSSETLSLPPMDKHARKMVHELANKFNVKSKSEGNGDQRRPTLYRTGRTMPYLESSFDEIVSRMTPRFLPRLDKKGKRTRGTPARTGHAAASYRDGEIVGATAPELGAGNRGRTMLEKMGWSSGTALGASDNKGILQPVTQAMKRTKAGLG